MFSPYRETIPSVLIFTFWELPSIVWLLNATLQHYFATGRKFLLPVSVLQAVLQRFLISDFDPLIHGKLPVAIL